MSARSALYVPGDAADKLARALDRGADELIVDLEDAVPAAGKDAARAAVAAWLLGLDKLDHRVARLPVVEEGARPPVVEEGARPPVVEEGARPPVVEEGARPPVVEEGALAPVSKPPAIYVRINPGALGATDVRAIASATSLTGIVVAKTETVAELEELDRLLTELGSSARVVPLLESASAILGAPELAAAPRVERLQVGEADLRADLGVTPGPDELELLHVRSAVVVASAAAGISPPIGPVSTEFRDLDAFRASTEALARLGFVGRACIHPAQVAVANEVFTPTAEQVAEAQDLLARFEAAGSGIALDARGRMIDEAVARQARLVLARTPSTTSTPSIRGES